MSLSVKVMILCLEPVNYVTYFKNCVIKVSLIIEIFKQFESFINLHF
jgi:hypothetical protein